MNMKIKRAVVNLGYYEWKGVRRLAEERPEPGGRASVGAVIRDLIRVELAKREQQPDAH